MWHTCIILPQERVGAGPRSKLGPAEACLPSKPQLPAAASGSPRLPARDPLTMEKRCRDLEDVVLSFLRGWQVLQECLFGRRAGRSEEMQKFVSAEDDFGFGTCVDGEDPDGDDSDAVDYDEELESAMVAKAMARLREMSPRGRRPSTRSVWQQSPDDATREAAVSARSRPLPLCKGHSRNASRSQSVSVWVQSPAEDTSSAAVRAVEGGARASKAI